MNGKRVGSINFRSTHTVFATRARCNHTIIYYRHVSTRITIVPAELLDTFRNGFGGPMGHSGESVHRARRSRRCGGRGTGRGPAAAALGNLRWSWCRELVFDPRECLLHCAHFGPIISSGRPRKHSGVYVGRTNQ